MFQDNPLLAQLKQKIQDSKPKVEGVVRSTDKAYGFLETPERKSYFLAPDTMKKVMHGDKILAAIATQADGKEQAEPLELLEPMLTRFIAKVQFNKAGKLQLAVDHPQIKQYIGAKKAKDLALPADETLQAGDWVVANLTTHPLRDDRFLFAQITQFICRGEDPLAPWWVTLARHEQSRYPVAGQADYPLLNADDERRDLTDLHFVTIDSADTQDMDDALHIRPIHNDQGEQNGWHLTVAIADPTAYIAQDSDIEMAARERCFTNYLPGFNIPMLPRELADELCSLTPNESKAALVCDIEVDLNGAVQGEPTFCNAWVQSRAKLTYDKVSDYLENKLNGTNETAWQPETAEIQAQVDALYDLTQARIQWRKQHSLLFKESPDYHFELADNGQVVAIHASHRRIANQIVEECMILANICAAHYLADHIGTGIFNTHVGFDPKNLTAVCDFLQKELAEQVPNANARYSGETLSTLAGYCQMRHDIEPMAGDYLEMRLRRWLTFAEFKTSLAPHFGLGLTGYATWTSPIRKYSDMVNHRLIKAHLRGESHFATPADSVLQRLQEARRQNRLVERDIADWLYCHYFAEQLASGQKLTFTAKIQDVTRGGLRVQLLDNGASVFIPASTIHQNRDEMQTNADELALYINGERRYKIGDELPVELVESKVDTRSLVGRLAL